MKKIITLVAFAVTILGSVMAQQQVQEMPPLPMNPKVRYGVLPNGLTYYIQHNELPEHQADFYIAQKVGSVLEEESQRGLAHFLEHMAFNGSTSFPGKGMLEYLQRNGVKFGTNVNAYTSIDETVYNIDAVPIDETLHPHIVDTCLLILHDWSSDLTLEDKEIDDERGVIHEEWRTRNSAQLRMYDVILPKLLPGNRYAERMPIGLMSVVDNFKYDELRNYYKKWYHPDLQGIFVVGDVDVDAVEKKIQELWADVHNPENEAERVYYPVEDNKEPLVAIASDPEMNGNVLAIMYKEDPNPDSYKRSQMGFLESIVKGMVTSLLNDRMNELAQKADAPFMGAGAGFGKYLVCKTKENFEVQVVFRENQWKKGMDAAMGVVLSAAKYGFTENEVSCVKADLQSQYEKAYNERDKQKNGTIVAEMQRNFLEAEPMTGIEMEYEMVKQILPMINVQMLNQVMSQLITPENVALMIMAQKNDTNILPTEQELVNAYNESLTQEVQPYEEKLSGVKLLPEGTKTKNGTIKKVQKGDWGSTVWTLSNGATVIYKQTDFKKDEVLMEAFSNGGTRLDLSQPNIVRQTMGTMASLGGLGQYSVTELPKVMAGRNASVGLSIDGQSESLSGSCVPKDLRALMELIYLNFTDLRYDEEAYQAYYNNLETQMAMMEGNPNKIMNDSLTATLYPGRKDMMPVTRRDLELLDYKTDYELGKARFANAGDFTFYFVGNVDVDSLRPMVEQYIASLPATKVREKRPADVLPTPGTRENRFDIKMKQPKTTVYDLFYLFNQPYSLKSGLECNMLGQCVSIIFTETIREKEGAVYSPMAQCSMDSETGLMTLLYGFDTGADKRENAEKVAYEELSKLAQEGIRDDVFQKVHDYMLKSHQAAVKENSYWLSKLQLKHEMGLNTVDSWEKDLESISPAELKTLVGRFLSQEATRIQYVANGIEK